MVYGRFERKLDFMRPVLERASFLHGRGNRCCMRVAIDNDGPEEQLFISHFRTLWSEAKSCFLTRRLQVGDFVSPQKSLGQGTTMRGSLTEPRNLINGNNRP